MSLDLSCPICFDVPREVVESACCNQIFCSSCVAKLIECPLCRCPSLVTVLNIPLQRVLESQQKVQSSSSSSSSSSSRSHISSSRDINLKARYIQDIQNLLKGTSFNNFSANSLSIQLKAFRLITDIQLLYGGKKGKVKEGSLIVVKALFIIGMELYGLTEDSLGLFKIGNHDEWPIELHYRWYEVIQNSICFRTFPHFPPYNTLLNNDTYLLATHRMVDDKGTTYIHVSGRNAWHMVSRKMPSSDITALRACDNFISFDDAFDQKEDMAAQYKKLLKEYTKDCFQKSEAKEQQRKEVERWKKELEARAQLEKERQLQEAEERRIQERGTAICSWVTPQLRKTLFSDLSWEQVKKFIFLNKEDDFICVYDDGRTIWLDSGIPKGRLYSLLKGRGGGKTNLVSVLAICFIGGALAYYVQFKDGCSYWSGIPEPLQSLLHSSKNLVNLEIAYDNKRQEFHYILQTDNSIQGNVPFHISWLTSDLTFYSLGINGQYFLRDSSGQMNVSLLTKDQYKFYRTLMAQKGGATEIYFGMNTSLIIRSKKL